MGFQCLDELFESYSGNLSLAHHSVSKPPFLLTDQLGPIILQGMITLVVVISGLIVLGMLVQCYFQSRIGYRLLSLGLAAILFGITLSGISFAKDMSSDSLEQRGKQLGAELNRTYRTLKDAHKLGMGNGPGVDVSSTVATYITIGTSFEEAEKVLQAAGFHLAPRPPRPINRLSAPEWEKALRFTIMGGLDLDHAFGYRADVVVSLSPDSPGDQGAHVKEISAQIQTTYL